MSYQKIKIVVDVHAVRQHWPNSFNHQSDYICPIRESEAVTIFIRRIIEHSWWRKKLISVSM